jgi:hypothetical protein
MFDQQHVHDLRYLQSRFDGLLQVSNEERFSRPPRALGLKDRLFIAIGDRLISLGCRLKDTTAVNKLSEECA